MRRLALAFSLLSLAACSVGADPGDEALVDHDDPSTRSDDATGPEDPTTSIAKTDVDEDVTELESPAARAAAAMGEPALPITTQDWMSRTPGLARQSLSKIFIPGTHDSGTYGIQSVYVRPVDDLFAPDGENPIIRAGQFIGVSDLWAKSQERTIAEQLGDGVRYLDFRPCREKSGALRICHGLYGPKMSELLDEIAAFVDAHPKEIVIVDNLNFGAFGDADHDKLAAMYASKLGSHILDYGAGDVSPESTLGELWQNHPGKNVVVIYEHARRPSQFWPASVSVGSWEETWDRSEKKTSLESAFENARPNKLFIFSGAATPDEGGTLITRSFDPAGTYPKSLAAMADDTNPVMLGWLRDEWSTKQANIITLDFYNRTCVFALTQRLNGNASASLDGCTIGDDTSWGNWRLGYERFGYGRGAGTPLGCSANEEKVAGLCYPKCEPGFASNIGFPYLCFRPCPSGYRDDGLTCFRDASIVSANNKKCPWYDKCGLTLKKGCSTCPSGYRNDGCTCRRDPHMIVKTRYDRGIGSPIHACGTGEEKSGLLCYPTCAEGFHGVGPMCMPNE